MLIVPVGPEVMVTVGATSSSNAPESQPGPCGRAFLRASVVPAVLQLARGPRSTAGLAAVIASTSTSPPWLLNAAARPAVAPVTSKSHSLSFSTLAPASVTASVPPQLVDVVPTTLRATMLEPICSVPLLTREMPPMPRAPPMLSAIVTRASDGEAAAVARGDSAGPADRGRVAEHGRVADEQEVLVGHLRPADPCDPGAVRTRCCCRRANAGAAGCRGSSRSRRRRPPARGCPSRARGRARRSRRG